MDVFFENHYEIGSRDIDLFGHCRPSAVLELLQDTATKAADEIHISRADMLRQYHAFWVVSRLSYTLKRPLLFEENVAVKTWHRGGRGAIMYREYDLTVGGEEVGQALTAWVLVNADSRKLFRLSQVKEFEGTDGGSLCRSDTLSKIQLPPQLSFAETRQMRYSDTDMNCHINHCRYADFLCDAVNLEKQLKPSEFVSSLGLCYLSECKPGESISLYAKHIDNTFSVLGQDSENTERFRGNLTLDKLPKED